MARGERSRMGEGGERKPDPKFYEDGVRRRYHSSGGMGGGVYFGDGNTRKRADGWARGRGKGAVSLVSFSSTPGVDRVHPACELIKKHPLSRHLHASHAKLIYL